MNYYKMIDMQHKPIEIFAQSMTIDDHDGFTRFRVRQLDGMLKTRMFKTANILTITEIEIPAFMSVKDWKTQREIALGQSEIPEQPEGEVV